MEKVGLEYRPASNVRAKDVLFKCIKWDLECISKYKKHVMFAEEKVR